MESIGITLSVTPTEILTDQPNFYQIASVVNNSSFLRIQTETYSGINFNTKYAPAVKVDVNNTFSTVDEVDYIGEQEVTASTAGGQIDTDRAFTDLTTVDGNIGKSIDPTIIGMTVI